MTNLPTSLKMALKTAMLPGSRAMRMLLPATLAILLTGCSMEPPLHLAGREDVDVRFGQVQVDLDVVWEVDSSRIGSWWYGWDETDVQRWGRVEYPMPTAYELRLYYLGRTSPQADYLTLSTFHIDEPSLRCRLNYGFHNLLAWSCIDSPSETQVVVIDESDPSSIIASTSQTRSGSRGVYNNPEIFYSAYETALEITDDPADYDFYLEDEDIWVKQLTSELTPVVYIYLVQVALYNNSGRIAGTTDDVHVSGLAGAVELQSGATSATDVGVTMEMRLKRSLPARRGRQADILGGKLTTFGLCGMERWRAGRGPIYSGTRADLPVTLHLPLRFANDTDSIYSYDVTSQFHAQAHGGVITVEIDADTIPVPSRPGGGGTAGGFDPTIAPQDSIEHVIPM